MREIARRLLVAIAATVPCLMAMAAEPRVALVIGNAEYEHAPLLANPLNDAADVTAALERLGFAVNLLENADQTALRRGLQQFARAASVAEVAVIYYAGHGIEVDRRNFLVPVDARLASGADTEFETIPLDLVIQSVSRAAFRLVILDACRENPFARKMQTADTTRSIGRGLALIEPPGGTLVAYAAKEGTLAEDGDGRNSPYAQALLSVLEQPDLEVGMVFRHVRDEVLAATGGRQEPFTYGSLPKEGIYFQSTPPASTTQAPSDSSTREIQPPLIVDELDEFRWTTQTVDVYADPSDASEVLLSVEPLVEVNVIGAVRGTQWLRVAPDEGGPGYVATAALSDRYPVVAADAVYRVMRRANIRGGPGITYDAVSRIEAGTDVRVTGKFLDTDWLRVVTASGEGYVKATALSDQFPVTPESGRYRAKQPVDVRFGFGVGWETLARLEPGDEVEMTGRVQVKGAEWLWVSLDAGGKGYLPAAGLMDTAADDKAFQEARTAGTSAAYGEYLSMYPNGQRAAEAGRLQTEAAKREEAQRLRPGSRFQDCDKCPQMIVVPSGSFTMGSPTSEARRREYEGPQHRVTIREPFAVGVYEVTFAEWDACVRDRGCGHRTDDEGRGRGRRPVDKLSWEDVRAYVGWLSQTTGKEYRLLSEAEWEYVARAGTRTARYWGESSRDQCRFENGADARAKALTGGGHILAACDDGHYWAAPVGSYEANGFGLHDLLGNVMEWVEDCWNYSYVGAPSDGSAWERGDCSGRVIRGGCWNCSNDSTRSANRAWAPTEDRLAGFRVARTITP